MRRFLRILEAALILTGIGAALYCGYAWWDSQRTQDKALQELSEMPAQPAEEPARNKRLPEGSPVGEVVVPRLGVAVAILEGTRPETLRHAVGHVSGTARPGQDGNMCLAGHRDTFFRPLRKIQPGDEVQVRYPGGTTKYRVEETEIVEPSNVSVLNATTHNELTLITCYPFYFIGSAPKRFIVHAKALQDTSRYHKSGVRASPPLRNSRYVARSSHGSGNGRDRRGAAARRRAHPPIPPQR